MKHRLLYASVDSKPKIGGVSALAQSVSVSLTKHYCSEAVYVGPKGTYFERGVANFKLYEDFQSDTKLRAGDGCEFEDDRIRDLFSKIIRNYDLYDVILWHPFYYGKGAVLAAKENGIGLTIFVHGTELTSQLRGVTQANYLYDASAYQKNSLPRRLFDTLNQADLLLTNSQYSKKLLANCLPNHKIKVVGCGIDDEIIKREHNIQPEYNHLFKIAAREDLGLENPKRKTLCMVGRLVPHKRQDLAIDIVAAHEDLQLIIIGDGPKKTDLEAQISRLGVQDRVFLVGSVSEDEKWRHLRASDGGFILSDYDLKTGGYEGFGIVMLEYLAACGSIFSSAGYGMKDLIDTYECGYDISSHLNNHGLSAQFIYDTLSDSGGYSAKIKRDREVLKTRFTWREVAKRVDSALQEIAS